MVHPRCLAEGRGAHPRRLAERRGVHPHRRAGTARRGVAALAALVLAGVCGKEGAEAQVAAASVDTSGVKVVVSDPLASDARCRLGDDPILSLGGGRGGSSHRFEGVAGVARLSDGSIAVVNRGTGEVRIFDRDGRHVRSMGSKDRRRPGRFRQFRTGGSLWVLPGDTLWIGDYRPWRFNLYSSTGEFVRTVEVRPRMDGPPEGGGVLDNGSSVNVDAGRAKFDFRDPEPRLVDAHSADGSPIRRLATLDGPRYGMWKGAAAALSTLFDPIPRVDARGSTVAITTAMDPEVIVLDEAFRPRHIVRWSDPDRKVADAHVQAFRAGLIESLGGRDGENWGPVAEDAVSDRRPVADVFPTVSALKVGRDGSLWVARYRRPGARWAWMIFGPKGDFVCWCPQLPLSPHEFGSDYVLGTRADEEGVVSVLMYEFVRPSP